MQLLSPEMARDSVKIANDNISVRMRLQEVASGGDLTCVQRASRLNTLVVAFFKYVAGEWGVGVRVLLCADGGSAEMVAKTAGMAPLF